MNAVTKITKPLVYDKIAAVQGELAHTGISKESENTFDRYKFRGIDAVYNALAPLLAKHGLCILPRIIERDCQERTSRKGEPMFYVTVTAEFDFVASEDGSIHTIRTYGEAMDRSDKATNKAMSAAYKYAAFMAFAIPTEGDNDADASTPEVEIAALISDAEWGEIASLMEVTNTDAKAFCTAYRITSVKDLPAASFERAKKQLNTKLSKMKETVDA